MNNVHVRGNTRLFDAHALVGCVRTDVAGEFQIGAILRERLEQGKQISSAGRERAAVL